MKNFIIFFLANTGSSAIISHLKKLKSHIDIVGFEPFDTHHMKKRLVGDDLKRMFELVLSDTTDNEEDNGNNSCLEEAREIYSKYSNKEFPTFDKTKSIGFKMRFRDWDTINEVVVNSDTVVFILMREDIFRWALSLYDSESNQFKLLQGKMDKNPQVTIDIKKFKEILNRCQSNLEGRYQLVEKLEENKVDVFPIYYEEYCHDKKSFFRNFFDTIDIPITDKQLEDFINIPNYFKKVHDEDISYFVTNYDELKEEFSDKYDF